MAKETFWFKCPCCGQHAPIGRLDEPPGELEVYLKSLGGKVSLSESEKKDMNIKGRGRAPGSMSYEEIDVPAEITEKFNRKLAKMKRKTA